MMGSHLRIVIALLFVAANSARADLPFLIPYHKLLNSDVVISGVLRHKTLQIVGNHEYNSATIHVVNVFAGPVVVDEELEIIWENQTGVTCPRSSYGHLQGKEAIWFLPYTGRRQYDANDPQRVMPLSRDVLANFLDYFSRSHGPPDTKLETSILNYIRARLAALP
jgi:hypothetical protein